MRLLFIALLLTGCAYNPELELGTYYELGSPVMGSNPTGVVRLTQPLYVSDGCQITVSYEHISSIPDTYDLHTVDQVGFTIKLPLRRP